MKRDMTREELREEVINHFLKNPNTSVKDYLESIPTSIGGLKGQLAGVICVLRDYEILSDTGVINGSVTVSVNKTKIVSNEVDKKWSES